MESFVTNDSSFGLQGDVDEVENNDSEDGTVTPEVRAIGVPSNTAETENVIVPLTPQSTELNVKDIVLLHGSILTLDGIEKLEKVSQYLNYWKTYMSDVLVTQLGVKKEDIGPVLLRVL